MNKATKVLLGCFVMAFAFASTSWAQDVTKIRDARTLVGVDTTVTVVGIMNTPDYGFGNGQFYVQDTTAGINVFYSGVGGSQNTDSPSYTGWTQGDTLSITGSISEFDGTVQIAPDTVEVLGAGTTRPFPTMITIEDLDVESEYQGMIVKLQDVSLADGETWPADAQTSSGVSVDVVSGDSAFVLRIDRDESYFDGAPAPTERFNLIGVLGRFDSDVQILPFDTTDVANIVQVTFNVNTATMPDTMMTDHYLAVFGGINSPTGASNPYLGQTVDWNNSTSLVTENQGGDYWSVTFDMAAGDGINYKWWAGVDASTPLINGSEQGWESGGNNWFELPWDAAMDTTAPLQWYETREAPFTSESDSVTVYFRVNVGAQVQTEAFDPENDMIGVRGTPGFFAGGWDASTLLEELPNPTGDNLFYGGYERIHKDSVANFASGIEYKFVIEGADGTVSWEDGGNSATAVADMDTTTYWKYFNNQAPTDAEVITTGLNFEVNVGILEGLGYFNSSLDSVYVTGTFNSWTNTGNQMAFNDISGNYEALNIPLTTTVGTQVSYKYYIRWDASRDDETSDNYFEFISANDDGWEEPGVTGGGNRLFNIIDGDQQPTRSEYFNGQEPQALMTSNNVDGGAIDVTFSIDMSPATEADTPFLPESDSVFLSVETPFFALTQDLPTYSDDIATRSLEIRDRMMFTDEDGDMVYELTLPLQLPTLNHIGFNVVYGEPTSATGTIIETGGGTDPGRRFYQYVTPQVDANLAVTWPSSFTFPTLTWTSDPVPFELPPDYTAVSNEVDGEVAESFQLMQNYPNPFNPTTNISFNLPNAADVNLSVYNLLGQRVATLIDGRTMNSGSHTVAFDARNLASGVYIYRLEAGNYISNKRMTLIK
jgi:hypothetical protein